MSGARDEILARIRRATALTGEAPARAAAVASHLHAHARGPLPAPGDDLVGRFRARAQQAAATVQTAAGASDIGAVISAYLAQHRLGNRLTVASAPLLAQIAWPPGIEAEYRALQAADPVVVTAAFAGIAETGSLVLLSGPATPTRMNFLPDNYICVLERAALVAHLEDVWEKVRAVGGMPRALNIISGPSRTADVEQTIQLGAHGPRRVLIVISG
jgi:L-lactate dehydrogenase complex protein LldG